MSVLELDARYLLADDEQSATLLLSGDFYRDLEGELDENGQPDVFLTTIHECFSGGFNSYDLRNRFSIQMQIKQGESLTLIARRHGKIVASLVNEIETSAASRVLLKPKGGFHLIIHQRRCFEPQEVLAITSLTSVFEHVAGQALTPATAALADLALAVNRHYEAANRLQPQVICLLSSAMKEAIQHNDEERSREALVYLCTALETLEVHRSVSIHLCYATALEASKP